MQKNNRSSYRMDFPGVFSFKRTEIPGEFTGKCQNLSQSGIQFVTDCPLKIEEVVSGVVTTGQKTFKPLCITMVVLRSKPCDASKYLISGEFISKDGENLEIK